jgi:hypothetical protein
MRKFKPKTQVINSLRKSAILEVLDLPEKKCIRRRIPWIPSRETHNEVIDTDPTDIITLPSNKTELAAKKEAADRNADLPPGYTLRKDGTVKLTKEVSIYRPRKQKH